MEGYDLGVKALLAMKTSELPANLRALVEKHKPGVITPPSIVTTDERLRKRKERFGSYALYASVIVQKDDKFVLVRYREPLWGEGWTIPGGAVEKGESIENAATREAREESGVEIELVRPVALVKTKIVAPSEGEQDYFLVLFHARMVGGDLAPDEKEMVEAKLATIEEIEKLILESGFPCLNPRIDPAINESIRKVALGK